MDGCSIQRFAAFNAHLVAVFAPALDSDLDPIPSAIAMAQATPDGTRQLLRAQAS